MKTDAAKFIEENSVSGLRAYVLAVVAMATLTAFRIALNPVLGEAAPHAFQAVLLVFIASLSGYGPGLFSIAVAIGMTWHTLPPYDLPLGQKLADEFTAALAGIMLCVVTARMRASLINAAIAHREADFLSREMNHRVKNLFAVVASMVTLSARDRPQAHEALSELRARIQSLADAHDVAMDEPDLVNFRELVNRLVAPYRKSGSGEPRVLVDGEDIDLPYDITTPMALVFHELATNAVKYGALAAQDGYVRLYWRRLDGMLEIKWQEHGTHKPAEPGPEGFGTVLVDASVAQMRGTMSRELNGEGLVMRLSVPATAPKQKQFQTACAADRQSGWSQSRSSLSAHRVSKRFLRRNPAIRDSRS